MIFPKEKNKFLFMQIKIKRNSRLQMFFKVTALKISQESTYVEVSF